MADSLLASAQLSQLLWTAAGALLVYVASVISYRILLHPLARFPGPFLGKFSDLLTNAAIVGERRTPMHASMLRRYGSPVRISTNELVFADRAAWADIYGQSSNPFPKDPALYSVFSVTGERNVLNEADRARHARLRRLLAAPFSPRALLRHEGQISARVEEYVTRVLGASGGKTVDIYERTHEHYVDIVSELSFGRSFGLLQGQSPGTMAELQAFTAVVPATSFFPLLKYLPIPAIQEGLKQVRNLERTSRALVRSFLAKHEAGDAETQGSFLQSLTDAVDEDTASKLSESELVENAIIFIVGGSGTTASTTLWLMWECARHPEVRDKLTAEIRAAFPDADVAPDYERASKLPYLQATIEETLRLWGPINGGCPRVSPGRQVSGHFVPAGAIVSNVAYATARDPAVFPDPEAFVPERWLASESSPSKMASNTKPAEAERSNVAHMKAMSRPFSYGPGTCVGRHLAEIGLTLTVARAYQLFDIDVDEAMTPEMMRVRDKGVFEPWGGKMLVRCTPAKR